MKVREWLAAHSAGALVHQWAPLELTDGRHVVRLRVSADAARVAQPNGERIRETAGAHALQQLADAMGARMLTARLYEERHRAATVRIPPRVAGIVRPGVNPMSVTPRQHSEAVDRAIQVATGTAGPWCVDNVSKTFVLDNECRDDHATAEDELLGAVNHGWIVARSECRWSANRGDGKPGWTWKGVPVGPCAALGREWMIIQNRGRRHGFGPAADQDDHSQGALLVDDPCTVDTHDATVGLLYRDAELCRLVTHDGVPLKWSRHPGVAELSISPSTGSSPVVAATDAPALPTRPGDRDDKGQDGKRRGDVWRWQTRMLGWSPAALPRWGADGDHGDETEDATIAALRVRRELRQHRPDLSFDTAAPASGVTLADAVYHRALSDLEQEVREDYGRNDGTRIREYARRFGLVPHRQPWPVNWCALAVATWLHEAADALSVPAPIDGSPGAQATMNQLEDAGLWVPRRQLSLEHFARGNVPVWRRGPPPPHPDSWMGHIGVIESFDPLTHTMTTIEGNSGPRGDRVARMKRSSRDAMLLGVGLLVATEARP